MHRAVKSRLSQSENWNGLMITDEGDNFPVSLETAVISRFPWATRPKSAEEVCLQSLLRERPLTR